MSPVLFDVLKVKQLIALNIIIFLTLKRDLDSKIVKMQIRLFSVHTDDKKELKMFPMN